jgi:hypothetical protein
MNRPPVGVMMTGVGSTMAFGPTYCFQPVSVTLPRSIQLFSIRFVAVSSRPL